MKPSKDDRRRRTVDAVAHLVALMHAHERGDVAAVAAAQAELKRQGVCVQLDSRAGSSEGVNHEG